MSNLHDLLDRLEIDSGANLYVHSSFNFLRHLEMSPQEIVACLLERVGRQGTLAMPSYWWNFDRSQRLGYNFQKVQTERPDFDIQQHPCNVGIIPEVFRLQAKTLRQLSYLVPIAAHGPLAQEMTRSALHEVNEFDPQGDSGFARILSHNFLITGLGVTNNTTSLSFLIDTELGPKHPQKFLHHQLQTGMVRDEHGQRHAHPGYWPLPHAVRHMRPQAVIEGSQYLQGTYKEAIVQGSIHFCYPSQEYHRQGLRLGRAALQANQVMPWLPQLERSDEA